MRKFTIIIFGALLLLAFAQCTKDKEKEQNIQLTNEAIEYIEDNIQLQLDMLADKDIPEMLQLLADWALELEGVQTDSIDENCVEITFVDGTISEIGIVDCTMEDPDFNFPSSKSIVGNLGQYDNKDIPIGGSKIFIWDPFPDFIRFVDDNNNVYEQAELINELFKDIANVKFLQGDRCTVDALRDLTDYAYIHIASHGNRRGFATGERVLDRDKYRQERDDNKVFTRFVTYKTVDGVEYKGNYYCVSNKFIDALSGRFNNALVINASCTGLPLLNPLLCRSFRNKGAATYCGFDKEVNTVFSHCVATDMIYYMFCYYNSGQAYEKTIRDYPSYNNGLLWGKVHFCMDGAEDLSLYQIPPVPTEGLVAYYPFNGNANDASGNGHNGEIIGNVTLSEDRNGNANCAYRFYGEPYNYISIPDDEALHLSTFTLNAWVYTDADNYADGYLICKGRDIYNGSYRLCVRNVGATNEYGGVNDAYVEEYPQVHEWHMITGSVQGDQAKFYIDGILMDARTLSHPFEYGNSEPLTFGMHYYGGVPNYWAYPLLGVMDDVRIYNRVLTPSEILGLYKE